MARMTEKASVFDKHIGHRIREQRENNGLTQGELARACGVSYQQVHKYEQGSNRISVGRLALIASVLQVPVQFLFEGIASAEEAVAAGAPENRLCLEVARNFRRIGNPRFQEAVHDLVRALASENGL